MTIITSKKAGLFTIAFAAAATTATLLAPTAGAQGEVRSAELGQVFSGQGTTRSAGDGEVNAFAADIRGPIDMTESSNAFRPMTCADDVSSQDKSGVGPFSASSANMYRVCG